MPTPCERCDALLVELALAKGRPEQVERLAHGLDAAASTWPCRHGARWTSPAAAAECPCIDHDLTPGSTL